MSEPYSSSLITAKSSFMNPNYRKNPLKNIVINYRKAVDKLFNYKYNFHASQYNIEDNFTSHSSLYGKRLVLINLIHSGRDICFNCTDREILYSIKKCLKIYHGKNHAEFKESAYGKALIYKSEYLPLDPPFENIMVYFQKNYFDRLTLIEQYFATNNHNYKHLIAKKKALYTYPPICIYLLPLPIDVTNLIREFVTYVDFIKCQHLRNEYEIERKKIV
tara:strand:- start:591 stop:1247 length:657 start_codon:yes stop_codon:yes gene_type:complete